MLELRKALAALLSVQPRLAEVLEQQSSLVGSAEQRLKWGAGANPALAEVFSPFLSFQIVCSKLLSTSMLSLSLFCSRFAITYCKRQEIYH